MWKKFPHFFTGYVYTFTMQNKNIEKGEYVNECLKLNNVFSGKFYGVIGIHQLFNVLLICQIFKKINSNNKKDRLSKDDLILLDEEENVKM